MVPSQRLQEFAGLIAIEFRVGRFDGQEEAVLGDVVESRVSVERMEQARQATQPDQGEEGEEAGEKHRQLEEDRDEGLPGAVFFAAHDGGVVVGHQVELE